MSKLDRYDLSILAELQRDARISNQELAERIGLSPSPCSRRVKQWRLACYHLSRSCHIGMVRYM